MVLNTLNSVIDDILLIIRNSNIVESENINRLQIKQWIQHYTVELIKQDIDKDGDINPEHIQTIERDLNVINMHPISNVLTMSTESKLPSMIDLNNRYSIIAITDMNGNVIQLGDEMKANRQHTRRFTCNDYIAYQKDGFLRVKGPNLIDRVCISAVFENSNLDPESCEDDDAPMRLSLDKIGTLKSMILQRELNIMIQMPTDIVNNSKNDILNANIGK